MKTGFYDEFDALQKDYSDADFGFLENEPVNLNTSAYQFLHGDCADFAAMLNAVYGYPIECIRYPDDDHVQGKLIHAYCVANFNGEKAYIDVRGVTTDPKLFWQEFENQVTYYEDGSIFCTNDGIDVPVQLEIWEDKEILFDGDYEGFTDDSIRLFIHQYDEYYNVQKSIEKMVDHSER